MNKVKSFNNLLGLVIVGVFLLQSCSKKIFVFNKSHSTKDFKVAEFDFDYLTIKSKIELNEANKTTKATALFRFKKDSVIWFNLSGAMGVQGARGIITKDSLKIINKIEKQYYMYDFSEVSKKFNFPIDFELIQAMLIGDMPKQITKKSIVKNSENRYVIDQNIENVSITNFVNETTLKLEEVDVTENETNNSLKLVYKDFININEQGLPFTIFISLIHHNEFGELETQLTIEHAKAEESDKPLSFPFSIPDKYEAK